MPNTNKEVAFAEKHAGIIYEMCADCVSHGKDRDVEDIIKIILDKFPDIDDSWDIQNIEKIKNRLSSL